MNDEKIQVQLRKINILLAGHTLKEEPTVCWTKTHKERPDRPRLTCTQIL